MTALNRVGESSFTMLQPNARTAHTSGVASFEHSLLSAVQQVEQLQGEADAQAQAVALGGGNLHETALSLEKADIGMRVLVKARNKLVELYQEVSRMNV